MYRVSPIGRPTAPITALDLSRRPSRGFRVRRYLTRLLALAALGGAGFLVWLAIQPILPKDEASDRGASPAAAQPHPRPASLPARIPKWAWEMNGWHSAPAARRGPRPAAAPARLPAWYWEWRAWRASQAG